MTVQAYPLQWPKGRSRRPAHKRERAKFGVQKTTHNSWVDSSGATRRSSYKERHSLSVSDAKKRIYAELERYEAKRCVISSNLVLNLDGTPRSGQREPDDPAVAVYFWLGNKEYCICCDKWDRTADNMAAIANHIGSIRGQIRWGCADAREAFAGFAALPDLNTQDDPFVALGFDPDESPTIEEVEKRYRHLAQIHHPDKEGGSASQFDRITKARDRARETLKQGAH